MPTPLQDEEYKKLGRFEVNRRRIVLINDNRQRRSGVYGVVRMAELHYSAYLPAFLASRLDRPPQLVAIKQIEIPNFSRMVKVKQVSLDLSSTSGWLVSIPSRPSQDIC